MSWCPKCNSEFDTGATRCPRCDVALEDAPADVVHKDLVEVWRAQGEMDAQLVRSILDGSGIDSMHHGEALRLTHAFTVDGLAEVRIFVREEDAHSARELLVVSELAVGCPKCEKISPINSTYCRHCNAELT